jgi:hypothetical protein
MSVRGGAIAVAASTAFVLIATCLVACGASERSVNPVATPAPSNTGFVLPPDIDRASGEGKRLEQLSTRCWANTETKACLDLGLALIGHDKGEAGERCLVRACEHDAGGDTACTLLRHYLRMGKLPDVPRAMTVLDRACAVGNKDVCDAEAEATGLAERQNVDAMLAARCEQGEARACSMLARRRGSADVPARSVEEAKEQYKKRLREEAEEPSDLPALSPQEIEKNLGGRWKRDCALESDCTQ